MRGACSLCPSARILQPGATYNQPPLIEKKNPFTSEWMETDNLTKTYQGFSPELSKEVLYRIHHGETFQDIIQLLRHSQNIYIHKYQDKEYFHIIPLTHLQCNGEIYPLFDGLDTALLSLQTFNGMIKTMKVKKANMKKSAAGGFTNATDVADYLVKKGMAFRNAHEVVGKIVLYCIDKDIAIDDLSMEEFKNFSPIFEEDIYKAIDLLTCVEERSVIGGPSSSSVKMQIEVLEKFIKENKENLSCLK